MFAACSDQMKKLCVHKNNAHQTVRTHRGFVSVHVHQTMHGTHSYNCMAMQNANLMQQQPARQAVLLGTRDTLTVNLFQRKHNSPIWVANT